MPWTDSLAALLASLPSNDRQTLLQTLTPAQRDDLAHDWRFVGRPTQQLPPGDWSVWLYMGGRGAGKTRTGAEITHAEVMAGRAGQLTLVGPTAAAVRDIMVEGESGILSVGRPNQRPDYEPSKRRLTWPNGARAALLSADEPDRFRGYQHDWIWPDELGAWRYPDAWDQLMLGLRLGQRPRGIATTTPKPLPWIRKLVSRRDIVVSRDSMHNNRANLAPAFVEQIASQYEGTRLYRQEVLGELLDDVAGALWSWSLLERARHNLAEHGAIPDMVRVVVAIDPAVTSGEEADETGIVVAGLGSDGLGYVLRDLSGRMPAIDWAQRAIAAYGEHGADRVVAEVNNGGDLVEAQIRTLDDTVAFKAVHATRGKRVRAEPVAALYEQGRVRHVGSFPRLEDQMVTFVPETPKSPDRMDALVWALTDLMIRAPSPLIVA